MHLAEGDDLFVKRFYAEGRRHPLRDRAKRAVRLDVAHREWRNLRHLQRARIRVPEPRALGVLPGGDTVLAMNFVAGRAFAQALAADRGSRRSLVLAVGDLVASLHAAGFTHWDLHQGNLLIGEDGPLLVDLQAAWRLRAGCARRRDLGELERSLQDSLSLAERVRLRARALGLERPFSPAARRRLRGVLEGILGALAERFRPADVRSGDSPEQETLLEVQFELPSRRDVKKCVVTKETIEKGLKPTLVTEAAPEEPGEQAAESA